MKISLRRATALQTVIQEAIEAIDITVNVALNEYENFEVALNSASQTCYVNDARRDSLLRAMYDIRALVGVANATSGISTMLANAAYVDKRLIQMSVMAESSTRVSHAVLQGKLKKMAMTTESQYSYGDVVSSGVFCAAELATIASMRLELKKRKQRINDQVLGLNVSVEIQLAQETVSALQVENLL